MLLSSLVVLQTPMHVQKSCSPAHAVERMTLPWQRQYPYDVLVVPAFRLRHRWERWPCLGQRVIDGAQQVVLFAPHATRHMALGGLRLHDQNTKELSITELERLTRRYTTEVAIIIGPTRDIPAPDMYTAGRAHHPWGSPGAC